MELPSWASHFAMFLFGTGVGAAGTYYAELFTDRRRSKEAKAEAKRKFREAQERMPKLIGAMKEATENPFFAVNREFTAIRDKRACIGYKPPGLYYYGNDYPGLIDMAHTLVDYGFIRCIRPDPDMSVYCMTEEFVELLRGS